MSKYILKRFLLMIPVIIGITFIIFCILDLTPGDPARLMLGENATEEAVAMKRAELQLDDPFFVRYFRFLFHAVQGDFGRSYSTNQLVAKEIFSRFPTTFILALSSVVVAVTFSVPLGILSATKQYSLVDIVSMIFAMLASAIPAFWLGLMLIIVFSLKLGWLPSFGFSGVKSMILPVVTMAMSFSAVIVRMTRSSMLEEIRQDYMRTALAKGASERYANQRHALKNAMIPVLTVVGIYFGALLGGSVIIEAVFTIPGLGTLLITAIRMKDIPTVLGCITVLAVTFSLVNLMVDLCYAFFDPRIKAQYKNSGGKKIRKLVKGTVK